VGTGRIRQESFMRLGLPELLVILFIVVLIFGANRLPELGKGIGRGIRNFKDATKEGANDKTD
jgi:sec-independent protein translocase protein TatA